MKCTIKFVVDRAACMRSFGLKVTFVCHFQNDSGDPSDLELLMTICRLLPPIPAAINARTHFSVSIEGMGTSTPLVIDMHLFRSKHGLSSYPIHLAAHNATLNPRVHSPVETPAEAVPEAHQSPAVILDRLPAAGRSQEGLAFPVAARPVVLHTRPLAAARRNQAD